MLGQQPKSKEVSRLHRAVTAGRVAGKITLAAANGLLPASAPVSQLAAHSTIDAVPIDVTQPEIGTVVVQIRNTNGTPGPVTEVMSELPPPSDAVLSVAGVSAEQPYTQERTSVDQ